MLHLFLKLISVESVTLFGFFCIGFFGYAFGYYREQSGPWFPYLFWTLLWVWGAAGWLIFLFGS